MSIGIPRTTPVALPTQPVASAADTPAREQQQAAAHARAPSALHVAMAMQDDLAMKMSAHRTRRGEAQADATATSTWIERVLDEEGPKKIADIKAALAAQRHPTRDDIRHLLTSLFPDPGDQVAVLRALLDDAQLEEMHEELALALERLLSEQEANGTRKAVTGGLNVAITARLAAQGSKLSPVLLRDCYRGFLSEPRDAIAQYELWVDVFGFEHRQVVVDFMGKAVIADLYSLDPSGSALEFRPLLDSVADLRVLRAADAVIARECWHPRLMKRIGVEEPVFARRILRIIREGKGWKDLFETCLSRAALVCSPAELSLLVQAFRRALRGIPVQLWRSGKDLATAQDELDELVAATLALETLRTNSSTRRTYRG